MESYETAYRLLKSVFYDKAYSSLRSGEEDALAVKLFYGVLEDDIRLSYELSKLADKRPPKGLEIIIKMGFYSLKKLSAPAYAVTDKLVEFAKKEFGVREAGFVNALLKKYPVTEIEPPRGKFAALSVKSAKPEWLVRAYAGQYKGQDLEKLLYSPAFTKEHIRVNTKKTDSAALEKKLADAGVEFERTDEGWFVKNCPAIKELYARGEITFQSLCSARAARLAVGLNPKSVLDLCAAPGGKSVYIAEKSQAEVTAWDLHPHRVGLIESYVSRMGVINVRAGVKDASVYDENYKEKFDLVLLDAPCSGFGVASKKPDVYLNRTFEDVLALSQLQYRLLQNAFAYAKRGGIVEYCTCTTLREENYNVVGKFLKEADAVLYTGELARADFKNAPEKGFYQYLPDGKGCDGFFVALLKKL